jgi:hypothetical protein
MSGGSMDYLGYKVKDASFREDTPERRALRKHLDKLSKALIAVEWNDSGDGADDEFQLIRDALGDAAILESAVQHAQEAHKELGDELARAEGSWLSKEMRTPAKGFQAIRAVEPGVSVVVRAKGEPKLVEWDGRFGVVTEKFNNAGLWSVNIGGDKLLVAPACHLEVL